MQEMWTYKQRMEINSHFCTAQRVMRNNLTVSCKVEKQKTLKTSARAIVWSVVGMEDFEMKFVKADEKEWLKLQGYSKKILLTGKDLKSEGNLVQIVNTEPHTNINPHYHKQMKEIYHVLKGNAIVFCSDIRVRVQPQDTILCEPGEVHGVVNDTDETFQIVVFKINAKEDDIIWV